MSHIGDYSDFKEKLERSFETQDEREKVKELFGNLKRELPALEKLLQESSDHWGYEDPVYRFYHQSFKVYNLQKHTITLLKSNIFLFFQRRKF